MPGRGFAGPSVDRKRLGLVEREQRRSVRLDGLDVVKTEEGARRRVEEGLAVRRRLRMQPGVRELDRACLEPVVDLAVELVSDDEPDDDGREDDGERDGRGGDEGETRAEAHGSRKA